MKKIIMSAVLICALLASAVNVAAARVECNVSLTGAYYNMSNGKAAADCPELVIDTTGFSLSGMAFHLILDGADWDYNKMRSLDSNIDVSATASNDIQLNFKKEFFKTQGTNSSASFSIPLYAKNFADGYIRLSVTDTPTYMDEAEFLFACNIAGGFSSKYDQAAAIYRSGTSTLSDLTLVDTANFAAVPGETRFIITLSDNSFDFVNAPEVEGTGKYEGKVSSTRDSAASISINITDETETGTGTIVIKGLQIKATSAKASASPEIIINSYRKLSFKTNEGKTISRSVDAKNTFSAGKFQEAAAIADVNSQANSEANKGSENTLTFTVGEYAYALNGKKTEITAPCIIENSRTMLPVRAFAEAVKADYIIYDAETKTVLIVKGQIRVSIEQNGDYMYVNAAQREVSAPAANINGSLYLPVRDICEALGMTDIYFDTETKTVTINF